MKPTSPPKPAGLRWKGHFAEFADKDLDLVKHALYKLEDSPGFGKLLDSIKGLSAEEAADKLEGEDERKWAAHTLMTHLPELVHALQRGVEVEVADIADALGVSRAEVAREPSHLNVARMQTAYKLLQGEGVREGSALESSIKSLFGANPEFNAALEVMGVDPSMLTKSFATVGGGLLQKCAQAVGEKMGNFISSPTGARKARRLMSKAAQAVFGDAHPESGGRALVTMPNTAATSPALINKLVDSGMTIARVNCAHDNPEVWGKIVGNIRTESPDMKILMDLAGPKNRTGDNEPLPNTLRVKVDKDDAAQRHGATVPVAIRFGDDAAQAAIDSKPAQIGLRDIDPALLQGLKKFHYEDAEGRHRTLKIDSMDDNGAMVSIDKSVAFHEGYPLYADKDCQEAVGWIGPAPLVKTTFNVKDGDQLVIKGDPEYVGHGKNDAGPATIGCRLPEAFQFVKVGDPVLLDDGSVPAYVESKSEEGLVLKVGYQDADPNAPKAERRIRSAKGINFPNSNLKIPALTAKDLEDLKFVAKYADVIAYSFVQTTEDVDLLVDAMKDLDVDLPSKTICLKIETKEAMRNLPALLARVEASGCKASVMIARGDLAAEVGFENLGRAQEHIANVCKARNIPFIYATGMMETMAKSDVPKRGEAVDLHTAVNVLEAPVTMFNKGPFMHKVLENFHKGYNKLRSFFAASQ